MSVNKELLTEIRRTHGEPVERRFRNRQNEHPDESVGTSLHEVLKGLGPGESTATRAHRIPGPGGPLEIEIIAVGVKKKR